MVLNPPIHTANLVGLDVGDRRAAIQRAEEERAELRRSKIEAQAAPSTTPEERIRVWEDLHGLRLPRNADHKLIRVIARDTALTVRQVNEEQVRRVDASHATIGSDT